MRVLFSEFDNGGCPSWWVDLTTEHSASSYGLPVVVLNGEPYGPGDLPPGELQVPTALIEAGRRAGYRCQPLEPDEAEAYWAETDPLPDHPWADRTEVRLIRY